MSLVCKPSNFCYRLPRASGTQACWVSDIVIFYSFRLFILLECQQNINNSMAAKTLWLLKADHLQELKQQIWSNDFCICGGFKRPPVSTYISNSFHFVYNLRFTPFFSACSISTSACSIFVNRKHQNNSKFIYKKPKQKKKNINRLLISIWQIKSRQRIYKMQLYYLVENCTIKNIFIYI